MTPTSPRRVALGLTLLLALTACSAAEPPAEAPVTVGQEEARTAAATPAPPPAPPTPPPADAAEPPGALHVSMADIAFAPARLELVAGEPVALTVSNDDAIEHDLDVPAAGLHVHAQPGAQEAATLRIDEPGTYEGRCLLPGHAEAGMVMEIVVE